MVETSKSGLCSLCAMAPNRVSCTLPGCKNSLLKPKVNNDVVAVGGVDEARQQMNELHNLIRRNSQK